MSAKKRSASGASVETLGLQKYSKELEKCLEFKSWLIPDETNPYLARCRFCVGKSYRPNKRTLLKHMESNVHAKNANTQIATCRTCLAKCDSSLMASIFAKERSTTLTYKDIVFSVTNICVERDKLPLAICSECCESAVIAYNFQKQAKIADRTLHMKTDTGVFADLDDPVDDHFTDYEVLDTEFEEYKMSIKDITPTADVKTELKGNECHLCSESFDDALSLVKHVQAKHKKVVHEKRSPAIKYAAKHKTLGRFKNRQTRPVMTSATGSRANGVHPCYIPILGVLEPKKSQDKPAEVKEKMRCGVCSALFGNEAELDAHCRDHGATEVIMCSLCERVYLKYSYYKRHFQVHHPEMEAVINAETTETVVELKDAGALDQILQCVRMTCIGDLIHANIEPSDQPMEIEAYVQTCGLCGCIILSPDELNKHNKTEHPDFAKRCYYCAKVFHIPAIRGRHLPLCKSMEMKYECLICGRRLRRECTLIDHVSKSHPESFERWSETRKTTTIYPCKKCLAVFHVETELKRHARICQEDEEEVECDHCHKTFKKKIYLAKHINYQHPPSGVRLKFLCSLCGKGFATDPQLIRHTRTHTKDFPYKCTLCPKEFATLHAFKYHQRTHTGDSPHVCKICDRRFIRGVSLRDHMLIHTGEKPFSCNECDMTFRQKYVLVTHVKKIHGNDPNSGRLLIENEDTRSPRTMPRVEISEPFSIKYSVETPEPEVASMTHRSPVKSECDVTSENLNEVNKPVRTEKIAYVFVKPKSPSKSCHQRRQPGRSLPDLV